jgi:hypothetical protein
MYCLFYGRSYPFLLLHFRVNLEHVVINLYTQLNLFQQYLWDT